ncbi:MAG: hypothetical protein IT557_19725 [Alphaproteobacteria bacterium]|nr:hypothetical protein [Alphaproteobacteria bacterium]
MSWFIRFTRFASAHMVYAQEQENSCGMACMMMVNFKMKKGLMFAGMAAGSAMQAVPVLGSYVGPTLTRAAIDYAVKTEPEVYKAYTKVTGSPYDGTAYSDCSFFPQVLADLGCGEWETVWMGQNGMGKGIKDAVKNGAPCIGLVAWDGGGAHFVVVDETHLGYGCVNDPWDGQVHITRLNEGGAVRYNAGKPVIGWSIGGKKHSYSEGSIGTFNGWLVRRKR